MKLLFVHQHLGAFAGAEANVLLSATELQRRGHQVALLHGSETGKGEQAWRETFNPCFRFEGNSCAVLRRVWSDFRPDLIYVHNLGELQVMEELLDSGVPLVRMVHDHDLYCMRSYKYNYFTREICRRPMSSYCVFPCLGVVRRNRQKGFPLKLVSYPGKQQEMRLNQRCQRMVVYSEYQKEELVRNGFDPQRIEIHVPIRCWGTEAEVSSFSKRNLVVFAGQIVRGKGVDLLLKALAKIATPFECAILGEGSHRPYCERLCARLGLRGKVHFEGFVSREQLKNYYLESSVFAFSSVWPEPFGMAGPEVMRYGVPVVGFDAGGTREWLTDGENGFLVPWMDIEQFAGRIEQLLRDKQLARELGRRGMERVNRDYDATRQMNGLESMFRRVLEERALEGVPGQPIRMLAE